MVMTITARLNYSSEHPADPPDWLDYVAFSECVGFLFLTLALVVSTLAFSLQKRTDILLKGPLPLLMMYLGASLHISATGISYLPLDFLQHIAVGACVLLDYWMTLGGVNLWCTGYAISITNNVLGCMDIVESHQKDRLSEFPSYIKADVHVNRQAAVSRHFDEEAMGLPSSPSNTLADIIEEVEVDGMATVDLGDVSPGPPRWTVDALVGSRGSVLLKRFGCAWRFSLPGLRLEKTRSRIQGLSLGICILYTMLFVVVCAVAQAVHASVPVKSQGSKVVLCESSLGFKFGTTLVMVGYVVICWTLLGLLRQHKMVPRFCVNEYMRMMFFLTGMFIVTAVINVFGVTRYSWGRFIYINMVLALYAVAYWCISGRVWLDVIRRSRVSDKKIMFQLCDFAVPKHFADLLGSEMNLEFLYQDFADWMVNEAQPVLVPNNLRLGEPDSTRAGSWEAGHFFQLNEAAPGLVDSHFVVFPDRLLPLFETTSLYVQKPDGEEILPARFHQSSIRGIESSNLYELDQSIAEERYSTGLLGLLVRLKLRLRSLFCRRSRQGHRRDEMYTPVGVHARSIESADVLFTHFMETKLSPEEQRRITDELIRDPVDRNRLVVRAADLPTLPSTADWYSSKLLVQSQNPSNSAYFMEIYTCALQLMENHYFVQFLKSKRASRKLKAIGDTNSAITDAVVSDAVIDSQNSPFDGKEGEDGLDREVDTERYSPVVLFNVFGYLPPKTRRRGANVPRYPAWVSEHLSRTGKGFGPLDDIYGDDDASPSSSRESTPAVSLELSRSSTGDEY